MSWYSTDFAFRVPISLDNVTTASVTTIDVDKVIPKDLDIFWNNVESTGFDMALTRADGWTFLDTGEVTAWDRGAGFSVATRTGKVRIDGLTVDADKHTMVWLYFGYPASADLAVGAVGALTAVPARFSQANSRNIGPIIPTSAEKTGSTTPATRFPVTSNETKYFWWDLSREIILRGQTYNDKLDYESIEYVTVTSETGGVASTIHTTTDVTIMQVAGRGAMVRTSVTGCVDATDYTLILHVETTFGGSTGRVFDRRVLLQCNDADDQ